ncbi:hypothetical protein PQC18_gp75 [Streptomyces phage Pablito]|uniref:Uncharacterized protein n=1 Tax=Streptomyces phage Pablito TaxID=2894593 RepID=A0AAE8YHD3_9CAUD|nr:hypothetical protein PQC18_gp75 [Streptomyces phage Pablito]UFD98013.1 hypothetical protein [Streptomyces phage Pablito]
MVSLDKTPVSIWNGQVRATINSGLRRNSLVMLQAELRRRSDKKN